MKDRHKLSNRAIFIFVAGTLLTSAASFANPVSNSETPELIEAAPSAEQYQCAIQAFGVTPQDASIAAQVAVNTQSVDQEIDVDNLLTQLPNDFLEGSPY